MMKAELLALLTALAIGTSPICAQVKFQVAEVDQILSNPDQYQGKVIALHGIVGTIASEQKAFTLLESTPGKTGRANLRFVSVAVQSGTQSVLPVPGQEAVIIGQILRATGSTSFLATQMFTNRADVQQILAEGSIRRASEKRPGDNLGRDAQPVDNSQ